MQSSFNILRNSGIKSHYGGQNKSQHSYNTVSATNVGGFGRELVQPLAAVSIPIMASFRLLIGQYELGLDMCHHLWILHAHVSVSVMFSHFHIGRDLFKCLFGWKYDEIWRRKHTVSKISVLVWTRPVCDCIRVSLCFLILPTKAGKFWFWYR